MVAKQNWAKNNYFTAFDKSASGIQQPYPKIEKYTILKSTELLWRNWKHDARIL